MTLKNSLSLIPARPPVDVHRVSRAEPGAEPGESPAPRAGKNRLSHRAFQLQPKLTEGYLKLTPSPGLRRPHSSNDSDDNRSPTDQAYVASRAVPTPSQVKVKGSEKQKGRQLRTRRASESFFESDSSDSSDFDTPVIGRASSVRVGSPRLIEHHSHNKGRQVKIFDPDAPVSDLSARPVDLIADLRSSRFDDRVDEEQARLEGDMREVGGSTTRLTSKSHVAFTAGNRRTTTSGGNAPASGGNTHAQANPNGLYLNPISEPEKADIAIASVPTLPRKESRRVRIRPSDLVINQQKHSRFRESVVTTPYPAIEARKGSLSSSVGTKEEEVDVPIIKAPSQRSTMKSTATGTELDRFPSPDQVELMFLDICLARHPAMNTTLEIQIVDKTVYDDEMLFNQIRVAYLHRLLGWSRLPFLALRSISHVSMNAPLMSSRSDFHMNDFLQHLSHPQLGRQRKTWVIWLRNQNRQSSLYISPVPQVSSTFAIEKRPLTVHSAEKRLSMQSDSGHSSSNHSIFPVFSLARLSFWRERTFEKGKKVDVSVSKPTSAKTFRQGSVSSEDGLSPRVKVELHHTFNFWMAGLLFLCTVTASIGASVLWIIFGVPGTRPGREQVTDWLESDIARDTSWSQSAALRVLTGLVLGLAMLTLGVLFEACLLSGAWILL